jgi:hypothetical protein
MRSRTQFMLALDRRALRASDTAPVGPQTAKAKSGPSSLNANHVGVLRGFVLAYSQNEVSGTMQRFRLLSHPRHWGAPVADVRNRLAAILRSTKHHPARHHEVAHRRAPCMRLTSHRMRLRFEEKISFNQPLAKATPPARTRYR